MNRIGKLTWPVISTVVSKLKDFSRSQAATYTVKVIICRKRCKIETLLLYTGIDDYWEVVYGLANSDNFSDLD